MKKNCEQGVVIPPLVEDPCDGERVPANCVVDSNLYSDLGLSENATQQQINNALYLAFKNLQAQLNNL